jgi:hypothetical protein
VKEAKSLLQCCRDHGVNFFHNAEVYANGRAEDREGIAGSDCWEKNVFPGFEGVVNCFSRKRRLFSFHGNPRKKMYVMVASLQNDDVWLGLRVKLEKNGLIAHMRRKLCFIQRFKIKSFV